MFPFFEIGVKEALALTSKNESCTQKSAEG